MNDTVMLTTVCYSTMAMMQVPVSGRTSDRYLALHELLPKGLTRWSKEDLDDLVEELSHDDTQTWERVLILLAHHQSPAAMEILTDLREQAPPDLAEFAELAYAESLTWLGFDYLRDSRDGPPVIRPTERFPYAA